MSQPLTVEEFLEHHGVKGMHWGVRRARSSSAGNSGVPDHSKRNKALKVGGTVLAVAVVAAGTAYLVKHPELLSKTAQSLSNKNTVEAGKKFAESVTREPTDVIHASRGKNKGFRFLQNGGLPDPLHEYERAGFPLSDNTHVRYGKNNEKIAVSFHDPKGRRDFAGRPLHHEVILPKEHAAGLNDFESVKQKAWSLVQARYEPFYQSSVNREF